MNNKLNREIPKQTAFILVLIFGFMSAWITIHVGKRIIENTKNSENLNNKTRMIKDIEKNQNISKNKIENQQ